MKSVVGRKSEASSGRMRVRAVKSSGGIVSRRRRIVGQYSGEGRKKGTLSVWY